MTNKNCLNCQNPLDTKSEFCPHCGAHQKKDRLSTREVFWELLEVILLWNKSFFKTFYSLLVSPAKVVNFYIQGGRLRYVNPLFYLLLCFFLYQLIISLIDYEVFFVQGLKGTVTGIHEVISSASEELDTEGIEKISKYAKILYFVLLLIISGFSKIAFTSNKYNFAEHLSINAYLLGQLTLIGMISFPIMFITDGNKDIRNITTVLVFGAYLVMFQYSVFRNNIFLSILKTAIMVFIFFILLSILFVTVGLFII